MKKILCVLSIILVIFLNTFSVYAEETTDYQHKVFYNFQRYLCNTAYKYLIDNNYISSDDKVAVVYNMSSSYIYFYTGAYQLGNSGVYSTGTYVYAYPYKFSNDEDYSNGTVPVNVSERSNSGSCFTVSMYLNRTNYQYYDTNFDWSYQSSPDEIFVSGTLQAMSQEEAYQLCFPSSSSSDVSINVFDTSSLEHKLNTITILIMFFIVYCYFLNPTIKILKLRKGDK